MKVNSIFSSFIATDFLKEIDNNKLKEYALALRKNSPGVIKSNFLGWQSDILKTPNDQITVFVDTLLKKGNFLKSHLGFKNNSIVYLNNLWININQKSSFNRPHIHPDCIFSGVYYVSCSEDSGKIVFKHPSIAQQLFIKEETLETFTEFNAATWSILPEAGKLVIFPSWLEHYVEPNVTEEERISIAFNMNVREGP